MTLEDFTRTLAAETRAELNDPQASFSSQGLDSLGLLTVLVTVEDLYSIEIDPSAFADGFPRTPAAMHAYAERTVSARTS